VVVSACIRLKKGFLVSGSADAGGGLVTEEVLDSGFWGLGAASAGTGSTDGVGEGKAPGVSSGSSWLAVGVLSSGVCCGASSDEEESSSAASASSCS